MKRAFSLVELSIVLVILGLLTGGILTGQNLIRASELRAVTTEFQSYQTATMTFRDKYFAIPGDMRNATDFWGAMTTGTCPNATAGTGTQTCNGDADGVLEDAAAANQTGEVFTFWQHLANAGLVEGSFTGRSGSASFVDANINENVPQSKVTNAGWSVYTWGTVSGDTGNFDGTYQNILSFGQQSTFLTEADVLIPEEAWNIDKKIDDGLPATGSIIARSRIDCTTQSDGSAITTSAAHAALKDAVYNFSDTGINCALVFHTGF